MKLLEASDVFESSKVPFYVSKFCFFYFATYEKNKNNFYISRTLFRDVFLYIFYMSFGIYWLHDLLKTPTVFTKSRSIILEIVIDLKCKVQLFQPFIILTIALWNRHVVLKILQKIDKIDRKLSSLGVHRDYQKDLRVSIYFYLSFSIANSMVSLFALMPSYVFEINQGSLPLKNYFFITSFVFSVTIGMTYVFTLIAINSRIKDVSKLINENGEKMTVNSFKSIMKLYSNFQDVLKLTNQYFSINSMEAFTEYTIHVSVMLLAFYDFCVREFKAENIAYFMGGVGYQYAVGGSIICLVIISEKVKENGRKIVIEMNKNIILKGNNKIVKFSQLLTLQTKNELIASCGVFDFNWKIIFNIITGSFSYLLVAIQFDMNYKDQSRDQ